MFTVRFSLLLLFVCALVPMRAAEPAKTQANVMVELSFAAKQAHADPFNELTLDVVFTDPVGTEWKVPAFWDGGANWKVRYASSTVGIHRWRSACSDAADAGLNGVEGTVEVSAYTGSNPLYRHGPVRVAGDQRHFEYADGTPFFWLGDTWWMGLCHRLHWPEEFQKLTADRKEKGFNVIQIVAGLYPDMHPFDPRGANEAGFPWEKEYARIRPEYFDAADARLKHLVEQGMTPCIVGAWGYFLPWMGVEKMKAHWRNLIARYGAMPVVWCAGGEANLPWYLAKGFPYDDREQVHGWTEVLRSIRATDPFRRPLTIHPTAIHFYTARHATDDAGLLDFDMLQTPHGQKEAVPVAVKAVRDSMAAAPRMPVIDGEASYEMLGDHLPTQWTRAMFWLCVMNGTKGHTYGANGIWQCNRKGEPHGPSPTAGSPKTGYGVISWDEAMVLPGSAQLGMGKRFLESLPWTKLEPMPESVAWAEETVTIPMGSWIWFPEGNPQEDAPVAARYFRGSFTVGKVPLKRAVLRLTADDKFTVWVNGKELGSRANWREPAEFELKPLLYPGANVVAVRAENMPAPVAKNPAGLLVGGVVEYADGTKTKLPSNEFWRVSNEEKAGWPEVPFADAAWVKAKVVAKFGEGPWGPLGKNDTGFPPQACGIGQELRVVYALEARDVVVRGLAPQGRYAVTYFDPVTGERTKATEGTASGGGEYRLATPTFGHDWVGLVEAKP